MKRLIVKVLLIIVQKLLLLIEKVVGSEIDEISFSSHPGVNWLDVQFWDKPLFFEWEEYKSCNYKDQLTDEIKITYWDIEEDFNTMKGVNYNE